MSPVWVLVVDALGAGPLRYRALHRGVDGVPAEALTRTLGEFEANGIVRRTVLPTLPPRVEYALTPLGSSLAAPIRAVRERAEARVDQVVAARDALP